MYRITTYEEKYNLGDIIQTIALSQLLPQCIGIPRHEVPLEKFKSLLYIVNGWHNRHMESPSDDSNCLFAGVYYNTELLDNNKITNWIRQSRYNFGARDPVTFEKTKKEGIKSELIGCSTLTFDEYSGIREGIYFVDSYNSPKSLKDGFYYTHKIKEKIIRNNLAIVKGKFVEINKGFDYNWIIASSYLEHYKKAEEVYTSRLHVALPCLAFGTPVYIEEPTRKEDRERFSILDAMEVPFKKLTVIDTTKWRDNYIKFLTNNNVEVLKNSEPKFPLV